MGGARRVQERVEPALVAVAWTVLVITLAIVVLTIPSVTGILVERLETSRETGLSPERTRQVAESVRAFVTSARAEPLPPTVEGREGFDARAVDHLEDVRSVLSGIRTALGVSALVLAVWVGWSAARSRRRAMARGIEAGGWLTEALVAAVGIFAVLGFERAFTALHGVFFAPGTWIFASDSLLIQLFPEPYWMAMGTIGMVLSALGGAVLVVAGRRLAARGIAHAP